MRFCLVLLWLSIYSVSAELLILPWPDLETELPLWRPDAPSSEKWPAIIYYHGTNGRPSIRLMRALRPLRVVRYNSSMRQAVNALLRSVPGVTHVTLLAFVCFFILAIVCVQMLKGRRTSTSALCDRVASE